MTKDTQPRKTQGGVTIIELVVVLAVVSVLVGMATFGLMDWMRGQDIKTAARATSDAFMLARAESMRTGENHIVAFGLGALANADADIVIARDGRPDLANCSFSTTDIVHRVSLDPDVSWGTAPSLAGDNAAPGDEGDASSNVKNGSSFTLPDLATPASWVYFEPDGIPRLFSSDGASCVTTGQPGEAGGAIYLTNGKRDYAVVLAPLGTTRVAAWNPNTSMWTN